jgi:hypothetical protein
LKKTSAESETENDDAKQKQALTEDKSSPGVDSQGRQQAKREDEAEVGRRPILAGGKPGRGPSNPLMTTTAKADAESGKTNTTALSAAQVHDSPASSSDAQRGPSVTGDEVTDTRTTAPSSWARVAEMPASMMDAAELSANDRNDPRYLRAVTDLLLGAPGPDTRFEDQLASYLEDLLPEPGHRRRILRGLVARLGYADGRHAPALRRQARAAVEACIGRKAGAVPRPANEPPAPAGEAHRVYLSGCAGLVLFAPFLPMLFDRLGLLDEARRLKPDTLSRARRALQLLSDLQSREAGPTDPLEKLLLGQEQRWRWAGEPAEPAPDIGLLTGLVQSVVARWAALGQTSPEGLQQAFVRRSGSLRQIEDAWRLTVEPGPFDMLLDKLPWSIGTLAMPWMATPLHVDWRGQDD